MSALKHTPLLTAWLLTLTSLIVVIVGVSLLSSDAGSPLPDVYRLAWTAISIEVVTLVVTLYAAVVGPYRNFKTTCLAMYAVVTPILIQITNTILSLTDEERAALPGANSSETRPNMVAASLIIVMIGNFQQMLFSAFTDNQTPSANQVGADSNIKV